MGATLLVAEQRQTYTLTDRGTYLAFKDELSLVPLVEGDPGCGTSTTRTWSIRASTRPLKRSEAAPLRPLSDRAQGPGVDRAVRPGEVRPAAVRPPATRREGGPDMPNEALRLLLPATPSCIGSLPAPWPSPAVATVLAMLVGIPIGYALARGRFPGRTMLLSAVNTGMGMPRWSSAFWSGCCSPGAGRWDRSDLIYTKQAMVLAQFVIATPLVVGFTAASVQSLPAELPDLLHRLGAGRLRRLWIIAGEAQLGLLAAIMAGFGAVISEVGASMTGGRKPARQHPGADHRDRHRDRAGQSPSGPGARASCCSRSPSG